MILPNDVVMHLAIVILGVCGFFVAKHIYNHKKAGLVLVCPIRFDCNTVVNSDYSRFFGIPVEILGMFYYSLITLLHAVLLFPQISSLDFLINSSLILSVMAFLFSLYLIGVQIFALKKGCSWCFVSAAVSTFIFIFSVL
ncbi:hypothetical protein A3I95_01540 [Candidatus Nomurabacteria bacterium RIFCSPLOWO2_02_FULL_44_12]|nr:MAG: hypothetical protein A3I95_01540 [Candidatus Nomurabacteria bacterium RIFCSPLOWO2_02_FULL_44_12]